MTGWLLAWNGAVFFLGDALFCYFPFLAPPGHSLSRRLPLVDILTLSLLRPEAVTVFDFHWGHKQSLRTHNVRSTPFVSRLGPVALSREQKSAFPPCYLLLLLAACCLLPSRIKHGNIPQQTTQPRPKLDADFHTHTHAHTHTSPITARCKDISKHAAITSSPCRVCGPRCLLRPRCQVWQRQCLL